MRLAEVLAPVVFVLLCAAFAAVLVLQEVRYQALRDDRFDVLDGEDWWPPSDTSCCSTAARSATTAAT